MYEGSYLELAGKGHDDATVTSSGSYPCFVGSITACVGVQMRRYDLGRRRKAVADACLSE